MILDQILSVKRKELHELKQRLPLEQLIKAIQKRENNSTRSLIRALSGKKIHLICELKKASPSGGIIRKQFKPIRLASEFQSAGAAAISVLTEKRFFKGNPSLLRQLKSKVRIPLLRKDFIFDPYQVYETAWLRADAFLIMIMLVSNKRLKEMLDLAKKLRLEVLVEIHTKQELARAISAGCKMIGINNRNLKTLKTDLSLSERLIPFIPKGITVIVESGIESGHDIQRYHRQGVYNFLVGTTLMKSRNVTQKIHELLNPNKKR